MDTTDRTVYPIPTGRTRDDAEAKLSEHAPWFYKFVFTNGAGTDTCDELTNPIYDTRTTLPYPFPDTIFQGRWQEVRCLDVACHEGWFAAQVALRRAPEVVGINIRKEHIAKASAIGEAGEIDHTTFSQGDSYRIKPEQHGTFNLTLFLGVLCHLYNPPEALGIVRSLAQTLCVIESQVARPRLEQEGLGGGAPRKGPRVAIIRSGERECKARNTCCACSHP